MKNIFKSAKHCDIYETRCGRLYLYEYKTEDGHLLSPMNRRFPVIIVDDNGVADKDLFSSEYDITKKFKLNF